MFFLLDFFLLFHFLESTFCTWGGGERGGDGGGGGGGGGGFLHFLCYMGFVIGGGDFNIFFPFFPPPLIIIPYLPFPLTLSFPFLFHSFVEIV